MKNNGMTSQCLELKLYKKRSLMNLEKDSINLLLTYRGPFSMRIISSIGKYINENIPAPDFAKMRLYRVLIELSQNVALYSAKRTHSIECETLGYGLVNIYNFEDKFICNTQNLIIPSHKDILLKNCTEINSTSENDLKSKKEKLRKESSIRDTGAHIGLITIKLISRNSIDFDFSQNSDDITFSITSTINKSN